MIVARYDERPEEKVTKFGTTGTTMRWLINRDNGARTFAMRRFVIQPGGEVPLHTHAEDHEIFVLAGEGIAFTEKEEIKIQQDMFIYVPPDENHGYRNTGRTLLIFLCIIPLLE